MLMNRDNLNQRIALASLILAAQEDGYIVEQINGHVGIVGGQIGWLGE